MSSLIFTGPVYPDDNVLSCIDAIKISVGPTDYVGKAPSDTGMISYITNLRAINGVLSFSLHFSNPITREVFRREVTSSKITDGVVCNAVLNNLSVSYGDKKFNISPCCVVASYSKKFDEKTTVNLICNNPVMCTLTTSELSIGLSSDVVLNSITGEDVLEDDNLGVLSVNGVQTSIGNIDINSVGNVTISVSVPKNEGNSYV